MGDIFDKISEDTGIRSATKTDILKEKIVEQLTSVKFWMGISFIVTGVLNAAGVPIPAEVMQGLGLIFAGRLSDDWRKALLTKKE